MAESLLQGDAKRITRKCVEMAKAGDPIAMKLAMERIAPPRKDHFVDLKLPKLKTANDAVKASSLIIQAVSEGKITPGEADELSKLITAFTETVHVADLAKKLEEYEDREQRRRSIASAP
jgi:hypothetical protein